MSNLLQTGAEFEKKLKERAESTEKMLNDEFRKLGESVSEAVTSNETKIRDAIALFTVSTEKSLEKHREGVKEAMMQHRKDVLKLAGNTGDVTGDSLSSVYREWRDALVSWRTDTDEPGRNQEAGRDIAETEREDMGRGVCAGREQEISGPSVREISRDDSLSGERVGTSEGVTQSDRAGNTFAERLRAAATGLYAAAERMGERLRGIAEDVFAYATGQRDAERAGHAVESAGAALERADRTLEPVIQRELEIREERLMQEREHALSLERERQLEIQERTLDGPSLGW